jgi:lysophospholipase L1-like esterase
MTKVSLIGDSVRLQYQPAVEKLLGAEYAVYGPNDNCRFAKYTLRGLFDWERRMKGSRIVHWNNGMWDICDLFGDGLFSTEEEYVQNMLRIADILLARHEVVIFATTTPVKAENKYNKLESIQRYNDLIVPLLREKGVIINDLYAACAADIDRYVAADTLHLSEDGIALCAQMVADCIKEAAAKLPTEKQLDAKALDPTGAPEMFM